MYPAIYCNSSLIVICGATATGKSSLALALAKRLKAIIISADSRQVYREFDIGTAKPTLAEQKDVPHYLIDICEPVETLTVADYQQQAQGLINSGAAQLKDEQGRQGDREIGRQGDRRGAEGENYAQIQQRPDSAISPALLVGGTGLYIRSIVQGLKIPRVAPNYELRSQLQQLGQFQLYAMLQQVDPVATQKIHANDSVRTLRALEVFYITGSPISEQQGENPPNYPILQIGLDCPNSDDLQRRIERRTEQMVAMGLVAEVDALCHKYGVDLPLLNTLGYQEFKQYWLGKISLTEAKKLTVLHTRQFAKRQRTWFRAYPEIAWFDSDDRQLIEKVWQKVEEFGQ
jgi:tRNA dimethylallyltransferase